MKRCPQCGKIYSDLIMQCPTCKTNMIKFQDTQDLIKFQDTQGDQNTQNISSQQLFEGKQKLDLKYLTEEIQPLVEAMNHISSILMEQLTSQKENVFISSYSIVITLMLLSHCSESGEHIEQLKNFLGIKDLSEEKILSAQKQLTMLLGANQSYDKCILKTANAIYIDKEMNLTPAFNKLSDIFLKNYQAALGVYTLSAESTKNEINGWVRDQTNGLINSILSQPFDNTTQMALLNAIYFKASWEKKFSKYTEEKIFHGQNGDTIVDMMNNEASFLYAETKCYQMIRLPYYGDYEMVVYLPKNAIDIMNWHYPNEAEIKNPHWQKRTVSLHMPKFELEYKKNLKNVLQALGLNGIFEDNYYDRLATDLLKAGIVIHKTMIKNDQKGSEAAAVTMVSMAVTSAPRPAKVEKVKEMNIDHPFYFIISNTKTKLKLFEGCIYNLGRKVEKAQLENIIANDKRIKELIEERRKSIEQEEKEKREKERRKDAKRKFKRCITQCIAWIVIIIFAMILYRC